MTAIKNRMVRSQGKNIERKEKNECVLFIVYGVRHPHVHAWQCRMFPPPPLLASFAWKSKTLLHWRGRCRPYAALPTASFWTQRLGGGPRLVAWAQPLAAARCRSQRKGPLSPPPAPANTLPLAECPWQCRRRQTRMLTAAQCACDNSHATAE